jgi:glycosyltransferase EpsJ
MPSVSVVVPIYNVERYLRQCVDSLLAQTLKNIEIILVDDGSPDSSGAIADEYADAYGNVICIHQNNSGLGPARNTGIAHAHGDYIGFVDSDDWAEPQMFEHLYWEACRSDADIVVSGHCDVTDGVKTICKRHPLAGKVLKGNEINGIRLNLYGHEPKDPVTESFPMAVWISLYRREMIESHGIRFHEILSEDVIFNLDAYACARCISFIGATDYCYRKEGQASITGTFKPQLLKRYEDFIALLSSKAEKEPCCGDCLVRVQRTAVDYARLYAGIVEQSNLSNSDKKKELARLVTSKMFSSYAVDLPHDALPTQQRVFQKALESGKFGYALALMHVRMGLKEMRGKLKHG